MNNSLEELLKKADETLKKNTNNTVYIHPLEKSLVYNIGIISYWMGLCLFVINLLICLINIKENKKIMLISIFSMIISIIGNSMMSFIGGPGARNFNPNYTLNRIGGIITIISFVIQLIILIISIQKNKKKEENLKCQE